MKIQLSISLLASDRLDTLKKCLDSLMPILNTISSELIIVFTGQDERVLDLARQYTDQIVPFEWCDDFSAARNAGLEKARGEWFMFIDDDEWFENTDEICRFFQSGDYKKYHTATYIQRNYKIVDGSAWSDTEPCRMVRITEKTCFRYSIHEELYPLLAPVKRLKDFVHHFAYTKKEDRLPRFHRNTTLLFKELEKDPENLKMYAQLVQEFYGNHFLEEAEKYCRQAIDIIRSKQLTDKRRHYLFAYYIEIICGRKDYERMWEEAVRILQKDKPYELARAKIYTQLVFAALPLKHYEEGLVYVKKYRNTIRSLEKNEVLQANQNILEMNYDLIAAEKKNIFMHGLTYAAQLEDYDSVEEILKWILADKDEKNKAYYQERLDGWKQQYEAQNEAILRCFARLHTEDIYFLFQKALYEEKYGDIQKAASLFRKCVAENEPYLQYQLAHMAIRSGFDISQLIGEFNLSTWSVCARDIVIHMKLDEYDTFAEKVERALLTYPLYYAVIQRFLLEKKMRFGKLEGEELLAIVEQYAQSVVGYYRCLYKEELFAEDMWFCLPEICCFAMLVVDALACEKAGDYKECIEYLGRAIHVQPDMENVVRRLLDYVEQKIAEPPHMQNKEFIALGNQIKTTVQNMIANNQYKEALPVLEQLIQLLPNDSDALKMKQEVLKHMGLTE